jgi:hypothetical protein
MITKLRDPFAYLGALYPFEGLTPIISARVKAILAVKEYPADALEYIEFHSTEDIKHAHLIKALIEETCADIPKPRSPSRRGLIASSPSIPFRSGPRLTSGRRRLEKGGDFPDPYPKIRRSRLR